MYKGVGGWEGGWGMTGVGGKLKAGSIFHWDVDNGAVSSVRDRYRHNPQDRQRWSSAVVWHHPYSY